MSLLHETNQAFGLLSDWIGAGGQPVSSANAQRRADRCLTCPMNDGSKPIEEWFKKKVFVSQVKRTIKLKEKMKRQVDGEDKLHLCSGCGCVLALKVWVPLKHILANTETNKLHPNCWILEETISDELKKV